MKHWNIFSIEKTMKVEAWPPLQLALEEQVMPDMQREGFKVVRLEQDPNSRQYTSVAVIGEK